MDSNNHDWIRGFFDLKKGMNLSTDYVRSNPSLFKVPGLYDLSSNKEIHSFKVVELGKINVLNQSVESMTILKANTKKKTKGSIYNGPAPAISKAEAVLNSLKEPDHSNVVRGTYEETEEKYRSLKDISTSSQWSTMPNRERLFNYNSNTPVKGLKKRHKPQFRSVTTPFDGKQIYNFQDLLPDELFLEDNIKSLHDSLYVLNNGETPEGRNTGGLHTELHMEEFHIDNSDPSKPKKAGLIGKLANQLGDQGLSDILGVDTTWDALLKEDPDVVRKAIHQVSEDAKKYINQTRMDQMFLKQGIDIMNHSIATDTSLEDILFGDNKNGIHTAIRDMDVAKYVTQNAGGSQTDDAIRQRMSRFLSSTRVGDDYGMFKPTSFIERELKTNSQFLNSIKTTLSDSYNPKTNRYTGFMSSQDTIFNIASAKSTMYEEARSLEMDYREYLDGRTDNMDILSTEARMGAENNLHEYMKEYSDIVEGNARHEEESRRVLSKHIAEGKSLANKPTSEFARAIQEQFLLHPDSEEIKVLSANRTTELIGVVNRADGNVKKAERLLPSAKAKEEQLKNVKNSQFLKFWSPIAEKMQEDKKFYEWQKDDLAEFQQQLNETPLKDPSYKPLYDKVQQLQRGNIAALFEESTGDKVSPIRQQQITDEIEALRAKTILDKGLDVDKEMSGDAHSSYEKALNDWKKQQGKVTELNRIITQEGYDPSMNIAPESLRTLREMINPVNPKLDADGNEIGFKATLLQEKPKDLDNKSRWLNAQANKTTIRMDKSEVGYQVTNIVGDNAYLKQEQVLLKDLKVNFDLNDQEIEEILPRMEERRMRAEVTREMAKEIAEDVTTSKRFVQIVYNPEAVDTAVGRKYGSFLLDKMQNAEAHINSLDPLTKPMSVAIDPRNLNEFFMNSLQRIDTPSQIQNDVKLPAYLSKMMQTHASFILNDPEKAMGTVAEALLQSIDEMSSNQRTIDVTDDGMIRRWMETSFGAGASGDMENLTPEQLNELEEFKANISNKTVQGRIEDHLFMNVLQKSHQIHFDEKGSGGRDNAIDLVVHELTKQNNGSAPSAHDIVQSLKTPGIREFMKENPHYNRLQKMGVEEYREYLANRDGLQHRSFDDIQEILRVDSEIDIDKPSDGSSRPYTLEEFSDYTDGASVSESLPEQYSDINHLRTMMEVMDEKNMDRIKAKVDLPEIGSVDAELYLGSQGDIIAEVHSLNKKFAVAQNSSAGQTFVSAVRSSPQTLHGTAQVTEDIGSPVGPKRDSYGSYANVQRSGNYMIPSNPSVTVDEMLNFYKGNKQMTYMDIETTGMNPKYIPEDVIQPLEIYAQKIQWDKENSSLSKNSEGEFVINNRKGEQIVRDKHIFIGLTDRTKEFAQEVMTNENFMFDVDGQEFSTIDYMTEQNMVRNKEIKRGRIEEAILNSSNSSKIQAVAGEKVERLMFLQNIAKYAFKQEDMGVADKKYYNMYAGNTNAPNFSDMSKEGRIPSGSNPWDVVRSEQQGYLNDLFSHVGMASDNLDNASKRGKSKFVFASGQIGTDIGGMLKSITSFLGKAPVIGQNVAKADMGTLLNAVDAWEQQSGMVAPDAFMSDLDEIRNYMFDDLKKATGRSKDKRTLSFSGDDKSFETVDDWSQGIANSDNMNQVRTRVNANKAKEIIGSIQGLESIYKNVQEGNFDLTPEQMDLLEDQGLADSFREVQPSLKAKPEADAFRSKINDRSVLEQQFMSQWLNPELKSHSSQSQMAHVGMNTEEYHLAKNDVKGNLAVVDNYAQQLRSDPNFATIDARGNVVAAFDNSGYKPNDFINMHTSVDGGRPGLYQINTMDNTKIGVSRINEDGSQTKMSVTASSSVELNRKFEGNFDYVPGTDIGNVITEYGEDQSRRSILNAMDSSYAFDTAGIEANQILQSGELTHSNVQNLKDVYDRAKPKYDRLKNADTSFDENTFSTEERIALQNMDLLGTTKVLDRMKKEASTTRTDSLLKTMEYMDSALGKTQGKFLKDVEQLQQVGAINNSQKTNIIKSWNDALKEEGMRRGAKTQVGNDLDLGSFTYGNPEQELKSIDNLRMDVSNARSIERSTWQLMNRMKHLSGGTTEEDVKGATLKNYVVPMLEQKGLVTKGSIGEGKTPSINQIVQEVQRNVASGEAFKAFEQFDPNAYNMLSGDEGFMSFLDEKRTQLLDAHMNSLSQAQQAHRTSIKHKEQLLRESDMYVPGMTLKPIAEEVDDILIDTLNLSGSGRLGSMPDSGLLHLVDLMKGSQNVGDVDTLNFIFSKLSHTATGGQNISGMIPDILESKGNWSPQVRAMEAMNWILPDGKGGYVENPNVSEHISGINGDYASKPLSQVPLDVLDGIAGQTFGTYTKDNQNSYLQGKIQNWKDDPSGSYRNHTGDKRSSQRVVTDADGNLMTKTVLEHTSAMNDSIKANDPGAKHSVINDSNFIDTSRPAPADTSGLQYSYVPRESVDSTPEPERAAGAIESKIADTYNSARDAGRSALDALDMGPGGAGRWVAGLGIAAFALNAFHKAGSPLRLEERPQGHGVAGATGQEEDDKAYNGRAAGANTPNTSGTTYVNGGEKGYTIQAKGRTSGDVNLSEMQNQVSQGIGVANINMKDERTSLDRSWLEGQFSSFIDRGYID